MVIPERVVLQRRLSVAVPGGFFLCCLVGAAVASRVVEDPDMSWVTGAAVMLIPVGAWVVGVLRSPHLVTLIPHELAVEVSTGRGPLRSARRIELLRGEPVRVVTREELIYDGRTSTRMDITRLLVGDQVIPIVLGRGREAALTQIGQQVAQALGAPLQVTRE